MEVTDVCKLDPANWPELDFMLVFKIWNRRNNAAVLFQHQQADRLLEALTYAKARAYGNTGKTAMVRAVHIL